MFPRISKDISKQATGNDTTQDAEQTSTMVFSQSEDRASVQMGIYEYEEDKRYRFDDGKTISTKL